MCVTTWEEHASDGIQKHRSVLLVDEEWGERLFRADYAAHSGIKQADPFHVRFIPRVIRSDL